MQYLFIDKYIYVVINKVINEFTDKFINRIYRKIG